MTDYMNLDRYNLQNIQLKIRSVFEEAGAELVSFNDLERTVSAELEESNGKKVRFVFYLSFAERGVIKIKAFQSENLCEDYLKAYSRYRDIYGDMDMFFSFDCKSDMLTVSKIERIETFAEKSDVQELVFEMLRAINRFCDFRSRGDEWDDEVNYGDER